MLVYYILIFMLMLTGIRYVAPGCGEAFNGALSRGSTDAIKGVFILVVFGRHVWPYVTSQMDDFSVYDRLFMTGDGMIRQLLVVMFLFYSGYGVAESIGVKGGSYVDSMPRKRVLVTLLNFSVAVGFFIVTGLILGNEISLQKGLLSLIGWESVGNSNWYIFCILVLYVATYLSFKFFRTKVSILLSLAIMTIMYIAVTQHYRGGAGLIPRFLISRV